MSALVEELCTTFGIQKCQTTAYHPQCNGQVERFHQMLFRMIGKLALDKKVQWEQHLPELFQVYNSTRSAVTGYSPHYLMFRRCPCLPVDFYFPMKGAHVRSCHIPAYVEEVRKLRPTYRPTAKWSSKSGIMIRLLVPCNSCQVMLSL